MIFENIGLTWLQIAHEIIDMVNYYSQCLEIIWFWLIETIFCFQCSEDDNSFTR